MGCKSIVNKERYNEKYIMVDVMQNIPQPRKYLKEMAPD